MRPATKKQVAVLRTIVALIEKRGIPPTLREICEHAGIRSVESAVKYVNALHKKGYIERFPATPRGIRVLKTE